MFKLAICDDEKEICTQIEEIILNNHEIFLYDVEVDVFYSCDRLISYIQNDNDLDLIFLDIEMEGLDGLDMGRIIRNNLNNQTLQIVYVSGKESYYKALFDVRPMHFILKPVDKISILNDVKLAMKLCSRFNEVFSYKKSSKTYRVSLKNILYFQSMNREITIVTTSGIDSFYGKLKDVYSQLKEYSFIQIHKSILVNYEHIIEFRYDEVKISNLDYLPISQSKRKRIRDFQMKYEM
jgi:Response regulator of the LytR/AlgR family